MKDFYDLWMIARTFRFDGTVLTTALRRTFERRGTAWPADVPSGLSMAFATEKGGQWNAFLGRERLGAAPDSFDAVLRDLRDFLLPIFADAGFEAVWPPAGQWTSEKIRP
jgi:hypothetical protein